MAKKRLLLIGALLVVSILGQVALRPCLGEAAAMPKNVQAESPTSTWDLKEDPSTGTIGNHSLTGKFLQIMLLVFLVGIVGWLFLKKVNSPWMPGRNQHLAVLESMSLGPRRSVYLIRAGNKHILVGNSPEGIRFLTDVSEAIENTRSQEPQ